MTAPDELPEQAERISQQIEAARHSFQETGNGLFAWMAIHLCLEGFSRQAPLPTREFPDWVRDYLVNSARGLRLLVDGYDVMAMPKREDFALDDHVAFVQAVETWQRNRIGLNEAPVSALRLLGLAGGKKGESKFRTFATDMKGYELVRLADATDDKVAIQFGKRMDADDDTRKVREHLRRGRQRFPYLDRGPSIYSAPDDTEK